MNVQRLAACVLVQAPAKLNLFFEVLGKRSDGYHEIETLMVPIDLCDTLGATLDPSGRVSTDCRWASPQDHSVDVFGPLPADDENLATRAAALLRSRAGVEAGISFTLTKRIPSAAGLGGGSSDAAAALVAANAIWNLGWSRAALAELAAELGSDVPFFLGAQAALCRGRGEQIEELPGLGTLHFVVVRPPEGLSTARVYASCRVPSKPRSATALIAALRTGDARRLGDLVYNALEVAAEPLSPWIKRLRDEFAREDCLANQMSGSGSSYFGICRHAWHARRVARRLRSRGVGHVYTASMSR